MKMDIRTYLDVEHELDGSADSIYGWRLKYLPEGWWTKDIAAPIMILLDKLDGLLLTKVSIKNGMLYLSCNDDSPYKDLFNRVAISVMRDSAIVCMVCGQKGFRRKLEPGKPCLCKTHYIEYVNL